MADRFRRRPSAFTMVSKIISQLTSDLTPKRMGSSPVWTKTLSRLGAMMLGFPIRLIGKSRHLIIEYLLYSSLLHQPVSYSNTKAN